MWVGQNDRNEHEQLDIIERGPSSHRDDMYRISESWKMILEILMSMQKFPTPSTANIRILFILDRDIDSLMTSRREGSGRSPGRREWG